MKSNFIICILLSISLSILADKLGKCDYELLTCENDGFINSEECLEFEHCPLGPDYENQRQVHNCHCDAAYRGTGCQLVAPPGDVCTKEGKKFDGSVFNPNAKSKPFECYIDHKIDAVLKLRLMRIEVSIEQGSSPNDMSVHFKALSRHPNETMGDGWNICRATLPDLDCHMTKCNHTVTSPASQSYWCAEAECTTCGSNWKETNCNKLLPFIVQEVEDSLPLQFELTNVNEGNGTATFTLHNDLSPISGPCMTGQCV